MLAMEARLRYGSFRISLDLARMMPYERLDAWRMCDQLAAEAYRISATWPRSELYGITAQVRRAALSAPTNLAEGSAKYGRREFARFTDMSLGSLAELSYLLRFANRLGYLSDADHARIQDLRNSAGKLTWRLLRSLRADS